MRNRAVVASILIAALLAGVAAGGEITVNGTGLVWTEPDRATLDVGWTGIEPEVATAVARANEAVAAIREALGDLGIDPADVRTVHYAVWREDRWDDSGEPHPIGYRVHHSLQLVVHDVELVGSAIAAAVDAGANQIGGIAFAVTDRVAVETEARAAAFAAARQRAEQLAALAGVTLGTVTSLEELEPRPAYAMVAADMGGRGGAPVAAGRYAVEVVVRVTFATLD